MKISDILGIMLTVIFMTIYEWPKLKKDHKKEKGAFIIITIVGLFLGLSLVYFPEMPTPTDFLVWLYKPLGSFLEK